MNPAESDISRQDQANRGAVAKRIPRFVEGGRQPLIFSADDMNVLVDSINRLLSMRITRGNTDLVIITDDEVIIQIAYDKSTLSLISA